VSVNKNINYDWINCFTCIYVNATGVNMVISLRGYQLDVSLTVPDNLRNTGLRGLFGNFNGERLDDLINMNGVTIEANSSDEKIYYNFGETCKLN